MSAVKKIKVLTLIDKWTLGGRQRVVFDLLDNLDADQFDSTLLFINTSAIVEELPRPDNTKVLSLVRPRYRLLIWPFRQLLRKEQPDIIVTHFNVLMLMPVYLAVAFSLCRSKLVITHHGDPEILLGRKSQGLAKVLVRFIHQRAARIVAVATRLNGHLAKLYSLPAGRIVTLFNPVDLERARSLAAVDVTLPETTDKMIVSVGRLVYPKDFATLISAFALVTKEVGSQLIIVGQGNEESALQALARDLGVAQKIKFVGQQNNPYAYLRQADVFALSSLTEGLPTILIEALACGCPVIASDQGFGQSDIIESGTNGLLVAAGNPQAMAAGMIELLTDSQLSHKFVENGRTSVTKFELKKTVAAWQKVLAEVAS
jgi:glycosyltransferase involved in cell wall biosynthesis